MATCIVRPRQPGAGAEIGPFTAGDIEIGERTGGVEEGLVETTFGLSRIGKEGRRIRRVDQPLHTGADNHRDPDNLCGAGHNGGAGLEGCGVGRDRSAESAEVTGAGEDEQPAGALPGGGAGQCWGEFSGVERVETQQGIGVDDMVGRGIGSDGVSGHIDAGDRGGEGARPGLRVQVGGQPYGCGDRVGVAVEEDTHEHTVRRQVASCRFGPMDVIELAGVDVIRGQKKLLDDITWQVREGERWLVIGPNGAGKTTLLQVLATQMHPTQGVAAILGEVLGAVDVFELRPRIGVASPVMAERVPRGERVSDVVVSAAYGVLGRWREEYGSEDHARAAALLAEFGTEDLADRTFGTLSEGERKRVQIARAMMTDPELLLLDEPSAGLDLAGREDLVGLLSELAQDEDAPTQVLVTHHVEEIPRGMTHVLLLQEGRVVAAGPIEETLTDEKMSQTFGLALQVEQHPDGRWTARAR